MINRLFRNLFIMAVIFAVICVVFKYGVEYYAFDATLILYTAYYFWKAERKPKN